MHGETVTVRVAGQDLKLPLNMGMVRALGHANVCPVYLANVAAMRHTGLAINLDQALTILALGMVGCGVAATPETLWVALRKRPGGANEVNDAAMTYLHAFIQDMPVLEVPAAPADPEAVEGPKE